jgi:MFS family permease
LPYSIIDLVCRKHFADKALHDPTYVLVPIELGGDNKQCFEPEVQRPVTLFMLVLNLSTGILSAIVAPKLGQMSDRYGRKRFMAIASMGGLVAEIATILAAKFPDVIDYRWLIVGYIADGLTGSFTAGSLLSNSYTSDCTPPSGRGVAIGYLHACLFTGLALGPMLSAYFIELTNNKLSIFYIALGCHTLFILFIIFILPDSLSRKRQLLARERYAKQLGVARHTLRASLAAIWTVNPFAPLVVFFPRGRSSTTKLRLNLVTLAAIDTIIMGSAVGAMTVILLYCEANFDWRTTESSHFVSAISMVRVFVLMCLFPILNYYVRVKPARRRRLEAGPDAVPVIEKNEGADEMDVWVIRFALLADFIGTSGYAFARSGPVFLASGLVTAFGGLASATISATLTKHFPADRVGQVLGALGLLHALARVVMPALFNGLYWATVVTFPQAVFVLLASLFGLMVVATVMIRPHGKCSGFHYGTNLCR